VWLHKTVNRDFPDTKIGRLKIPLSIFTGYLAMMIGVGMTILVQSSSITTSTLTPLVGLGVITIERAYPITLGANIGTTVTGILAALSSDGTKLANALQVALAHLFFNISGIIIWYPIPFMRKIPISAAKAMGNTTAKYRWFAVVYIILTFFLFPAAVFGLSLISKWALIGVGVPFLLLMSSIVAVNILQKKKPSVLPERLRDWEWLPLYLHSLRPYDSKMKALFSCCRKEEPTEIGLENC
jgi:sodium-dependent phosphate cotransporter